MKKHWLRGLLLGISMALLLAGGVALAQGLYATRDKACVECWPMERDGPKPLPISPPDEYVVTLTYGGWIQNPLYSLCTRQLPPNMAPWPWVCFPPPSQDPRTIEWWFTCEGNFLTELPLLPEGVDASDGIESLYGRWTFEVEQRNNGTTLDSAHVSWRFAEHCEEFVPEPGTIMLLGTGLAGLAGYATLRLRSGQALRWRTRE